VLKFRYLQFTSQRTSVR